MALRAVPDHPKFADLEARIDRPKYSTLGILETIWHFAGRYTPQGNIGKYPDHAIETWAEWDGEPGKLIEALVESRWIDRDPVHRLLVHDWPQHADKACKNALMRAKLPFCTPSVRTEHVPSTNEKPESSTASRLPVPEPVPEPEPVRELSLLSPQPATTGPKPSDFPKTWNELCGTLPKVEAFSDSRRKKVQARIRQGVTLDRFEQAVKACTEKPFLRGENDRGWTATFDWLVANDRNIEKAITEPYGLSTNGTQRGNNDWRNSKEYEDIE